MTLDKILTILDTKMPSALADDDWIVHINAAIRKYGRYIGKDDMYSFDIAEPLDMYPLPTYVTGAGIIAVVANSKQLRPVRYCDTIPDGCFCLSPAGYLMFGTDYRSGTRIDILYDTVTQFLTAGEIRAQADDEADALSMYQSQNCNADDEYIDAIIYGAMSGAAEAAEDIAAAANFKSQADDIVRGAKQSRYRSTGKYPTTQIVRGLDRRWHC